MVSPKLAPWLSDYLKSAEQALGTNLSSAEYTGAYRDKKLMILHVRMLFIFLNVLILANNVYTVSRFT